MALSDGLLLCLLRFGDLVSDDCAEFVSSSVSIFTPSSALAFLSDSLSTCGIFESPIVKRVTPPTSSNPAPYIMSPTGIGPSTAHNHHIEAAHHSTVSASSPS